MLLECEEQSFDAQHLAAGEYWNFKGLYVFLLLLVRDGNKFEWFDSGDATKITA